MCRLGHTFPCSIKCNCRPGMQLKSSVHHWKNIEVACRIERKGNVQDT